MGVRAEHRGHAAVEVPAHRHLLAGQLGVEVDEERVPPSGKGGEQLVDGGERVALDLEMHLPAQVDHADPHARRLDDRVPAPRIRLGEVQRTQHARLRVEIGIDLAMAVGVVAEGDDVGARLEELLRRLLRDADPSGAVLAVDDDEIGHVLGAQSGHRRRQCLATGPPDDVPYEKEAHGGLSLEDRSAGLVLPLAFGR